MGGLEKRKEAGGARHANVLMAFHLFGGGKGFGRKTGRQGTHRPADPSGHLIIRGRERTKSRAEHLQKLHILEQRERRR